jgi:hypothetical protein
MIRIPGARLIPINFNPHSGSSACALILKSPATMQEMSRYTGGSADNTPHNAEFTRLANVVETAFENSSYRNKEHRTKSGVPIRLEPYQKIGIAFALARRGRAGLFDPMGLGKTVQAIGLAVSCPENYLPLVVVCPRNAIGAWEKQLGGTGDIHSAWVKPGALRVRLIQSQAELVLAAVDIASEKDPDIAYIIWNELLTEPKGTRTKSEAAVRGQERDAALKTIANALSKRGLLVFDEAHYFRVPESEMFRRGYMMATTAAHVLALTGTPSLSTVTQTLPILALVDPQSNVIPEVRQFSGLFSDPPTAGWADVQKSFIERHAGKSTDDAPTVARLPESGDLKNFAPEYSDAHARSVENQFRQMVVRRSRADVVTKTKSPPLAVGIGKKDRALFLEPVTTAGAISRTSDQPHKFYQRAGLMALLDGQILHHVLDRFITARQTPDQQIAELLKSTRVRGIIEQFRCATARLKSGVGTESAEEMAQEVVPAAVRRFGQGLHKDDSGATLYRPTVYFADNLSTVYDLAGRLWDTYSTIPGFELYIYSGSRAGRVIGSKAAADATLRDVTLDNYRGDDALSKIADRFKPDDYLEPRILVAAQAGREGVDLPAGAEVIFVQRFDAPGLEEQAEDRINRANRHPNAPPPSIRYYMPEHYNSFVLLNRLERRRAEALRTYGETPTSDFSTPLSFAYGAMTGNARMEYLRMSFAAEREVTSNFREYILSRIAWAQALVQADRSAASALSRNLLDSERVYHDLMQLPELYRFIKDWCEPPKRRQAAAPKAPAAAPTTRAQAGEAVAPTGRVQTTPDIPVARTGPSTIRRVAGTPAPAAAPIRRAPSQPVVMFRGKRGSWQPVDLLMNSTAALVPGRFIRFEERGRPIEMNARIAPQPLGAPPSARFYIKTTTDGTDAELRPMVTRLPAFDRLFRLLVFTPDGIVSNPRWPF